MDFYNNLNFEQLKAELLHEVKNPVSLIKANIDYLQANDSGGVYEKNFGIIKKELQKITTVVLDFLKSSKFLQTSEKEVIFIYDLISEIVEEFDTPFKDGKKIKFSLDCTDKDIKILGEYSKLCIVFFNLYKNSIEAIKNIGEIKAFIEREGDEVIIKITDNGDGLDENYKNNIGTPFFTTKINGSGLGLSICKKVIESHKGSFKIFNNNDKGCTALIKLKCH